MILYIIWYDYRPCKVVIHRLQELCSCTTLALYLLAAADDIPWQINESIHESIGQLLTVNNKTNYHTIDLYRPWKIARGRADITLTTGWYSVSDGRVRRLQTAMHASATDVSDWLLQAARHCLPRRYVNTAAEDQSFYHSATLISSFQHIPNYFRCRFRRVRSYDDRWRGYNTAVFILAPISLGRHQPSTSSRADVDARAWYRCRYENIRVITSK